MSWTRWRRDFPQAVTSKLMSDLRRADLIICCARHLYEARLAAGMRAVDLVPNAAEGAGLRQRYDLRQQLAIGDDSTIAVHVSNLKPVKRALDLVVSANRMRHLSDLVFVIVGEGPTRAPMEEACDGFGIADRFRFVGWVEPRQVAGYLHLADLVVMPSAEEGMSLVCLEAMACGRLVIASDIPGMREIITDGETGLLFEMGNTEDLTRTLHNAAHDAALRVRIGRAARSYVQQHHRIEDMVARYESLLTNLVRGGSNRSRADRTAAGTDAEAASGNTASAGAWPVSGGSRR
jgi:glycosyltransferase involved in cell wall biosynthesis